MTRLRLADGGWVLIPLGLLIVLLLTWGLAPALMRMSERPPGDGINPETYLFNLDDVRLPERAPLDVALLYRDMVPVLDAPASIIDVQTASAEKPRKGPFLTTKDLVIGVERNGDARAYPLLLLNVHEAIHDDFHGPMLVTWHWPSGATAVYEPTIDGVPRRFGVSGLVAGGGQLLYVRNDDRTVGGESLVSQFTGRSISGQPFQLQPISHRLTTWATWKEAHPDTSVVAGVEALRRRYADGKPGRYFHSKRLLFDVQVPADGPDAKSPALVLEFEGRQTVVTANAVRAQGGEKVVAVGPHEVRVELIDGGHRLSVHAPPEVVVRHGLWYLVHALADRPQTP